MSNAKAKDRFPHARARLLQVLQVLLNEKYIDISIRYRCNGGATLATVEGGAALRVLASFGAAVKNSRIFRE